MIVNFEAWGKLIEAWATGDPIDGVDGAFPLPRDLDDVKAQCATVAGKMGLTTTGQDPLWKAVIDIPASMTGLAIMQNSPEVLGIRLPNKKGFKDALAALLQGGNYNLPDFYARQFAANITFPGGVSDKKRFLAERIGDYSVSNCA